MEQAVHSIARSLQNRNGLLMRGRLESRQGLGQEQSQECSEEWQGFAGVVVDGGLESLRGVKKTQLRSEDRPLLF